MLGRVLCVCACICAGLVVRRFRSVSAFKSFEVVPHLLAHPKSQPRLVGKRAPAASALPGRHLATGRKVVVEKPVATAACSVFDKQQIGWVFA